jgi:hypothetical protein
MSGLWSSFRGYVTSWALMDRAGHKLPKTLPPSCASHVVPAVLHADRPDTTRTQNSMFGIRNLWEPRELSQPNQLDMVGDRGFEPPAPWSRTWGKEPNFVAIQPFEWCFNRLILAQLRQFWRNVNPELQTSTIGSPWFALGGAPNLESFPLTDSHTPTVVRTY